jgi:SAM-dependent methyltransferase
MTDAVSHSGDLRGQLDIADFFDEQYRSDDRYWWRGKDRYAPDADSYPFSLLTQMTLRLIGPPPGRVLDLGAGEGADSIRLALLGYTVGAVEISKVGAEKILMFAEEAGVTVSVEVADIVTYEPDGEFDLILCNGVLHYVDDKKPVVERMQTATRPGGINVISLWSTYTQVPDCHKVVPVYCDDEDGLVAKMYDQWTKELFYFERNRPETSHSGMPSHSHSHIKMIARRPEIIQGRALDEISGESPGSQ